MSQSNESPPSALSDLHFTPKERDLIRMEFMPRWNSARSIHDGIVVKRWVTGPNKSKPKPSATVPSMLDRGLLSMTDDGRHWLQANFTDAGFAALKRMAADKRALPPDLYQHLIDEITAQGDGP
ncbi:hypothetical protein [Azospirillum sp. SYSU D00513]|uniref:hypothetical protein n=1 Tax=Azospirillum sp. SYSU D00513 TaxID=2812561 RepID=UPI001A95C86C|nr:hypothetical protein [Azospirillum sp. SYSU D00513]